MENLEEDDLGLEVNIDNIMKDIEESDKEPEEVSEAELDSNDLNQALEYINNETEKVKEQTLAIKRGETLPVTEENETSIQEMTKKALSKIDKVDENTDKIFDLFYTPIAMGKDRSDMSKQSLVESQRIKVDMVNAIANLIQAQAKLESAKAKAAGNSNGTPIINIMQGADVGIDVSNLKSAN